ncbi:MAG: FKBP-type peptidyl-prolyl cis-trans isomerase [Gemmataceae bacterium]
MKQWEVAEGKGDPCPKGATVTIHYTGWLTDGKKFDSSRDGDPAKFPLNRLIKGWQEGVPGMKPGAKRYFVIPPELGYGAKGAGDDIPPNATLVFEIELIDFKK